MIIRLIADRYSVTPTQVVEAVRWIEQHKEFVSKLKNGSWFTLMGMVLTGMALAMWEGFKHLASGGKSG